MRFTVPCWLAFLLASCASPPGKTSDSLRLMAYVTRDYEPKFTTNSASPFGKLSINPDLVDQGARLTEVCRFTLDVVSLGRRVHATGAVILGLRARGSFGPIWIDLVPDPPFRALTFPRRLYLIHLADGYQALTPQPGTREFWRATTPEDYA